MTSLTTASTTAPTTALTTMCKGGTLRLCHSCDHSFAILVQKMQSLMVVIGISIVSGGKVILKIHLEVTMLRSAFPQEGIRDVPFLSIVSHKFLLHGS
jgi:hypothetical protein